MEEIRKAYSEKSTCCPNCDYDSKGNTWSLKRHMGRCKDKIAQPTECSKCGFAPVRLDSLKRHMKTCNGPKGGAG